MGVPQNEWFVLGNPIKMDDLGVPPFQETPIYGGFLKWGYPQIINFHRIFHCKPLLLGYPSIAGNPHIYYI